MNSNALHRLTLVCLILIGACLPGCVTLRIVLDASNAPPPAATAKTAATEATKAPPDAQAATSDQPAEKAASETAPPPGTPPAQDSATDKPTDPVACPPSSGNPDDDNNEKVKVELRGRIQADAVLVNQSERDKAIVGELQNATGFRRARLGAQGSIGDQVKYVAEFDFAGGTIAFKDVFVALVDLPIIRQLRIGHFLEPFSLESETSASAITFNERSPISALDPDRNWGVAIFTYTDNERATFAIGAFRTGSDASGNDISDGDMAYTTRLTGLPWYEAEGRYLMHIGGAFSQRYPPDNVVTFNQGPRSSLLQFGTDDPLVPFVPNISIPANQNQLYNVQWATVLDSLSFQAEWNATTIEQIGGGPVFLHGSYIYGSYFITGEHREYDRQEGAFKFPHVRSPFICLNGKGWKSCGPGAWELTARFAYLNFADANIPLTSTGLKQGDKLAETTLGINWYLNDNARMMFNYSHVVTVDPNFGPSAADAFFIRTEVFW